MLFSITQQSIDLMAISTGDKKLLQSLEDPRTSASSHTDHTDVSELSEMGSDGEETESDGSSEVCSVFAPHHRTPYT